MDQKLMVPLSIVVAGVIIAGAIVVTNGVGSKGGDDSVNPAPTPQPVATVAPGLDDDAVLGDPDAPVTVIEFGDFQCPYCGALHENIGTKLRAEYIETGKVKMVYRDFPLYNIHPDAAPAAEAAECAKEQGKFWAYHDQLFANQAALGADLYTSIAKNLGLNMTQFNSCVETRKYESEVTKDYQDGIAAGVDGTPASFVNGTLISGAVPYTTFKAAVDAALAAQ